MYIVSEITGKKYATVAECKEDERIYIARRKSEEKAKLTAELDEAWEKVTDSIENYIEIAERIDPEAVADMKTILRFMKM